MLKTATASAVLLFAAISSSRAAPIDYFYSGQVSATVSGGQTYRGAGELIGHADTATVNATPFGIRSNVLSSLQIVIPGVLTATVLGPTYAFSADNAFGFGLGTPASGTDFADSFPPNYRDYDLATAYGPVSVAGSLVGGTALTDAGRITLQITAPSLAATVPEPATPLLLLGSLAAVTLVRAGANRRGNQAAIRSGLNRP